jgi:hypothetical protein
MTAIKGGLKLPTLGDAVTLSATPLSSANLKTVCTAGNNTAGVKVYNVTIPAGAVGARFALFQRDAGVDDDHDLGVLAPDGTWGYSGNDGSNESVQLSAPAAGNYKVCVVAYGSSAPSAMVHKLSSWIVTPADVGGKLTVALPSKVVAGVNTPVGISWSGLENDKSYLGGVQFQDLSGVVQATTLVNVDTGLATVPVAESDRSKAKLKD